MICASYIRIPMRLIPFLFSREVIELPTKCSLELLDRRISRLPFGQQDFLAFPFRLETLLPFHQWLRLHKRPSRAYSYSWGFQLPIVLFPTMGKIRPVLPPQAVVALGGPSLVEPNLGHLPSLASSQVLFPLFLNLLAAFNFNPNLIGVQS